jgi:serralysin
MTAPNASGTTSSVSLPSSQLAGAQTIDALLADNPRKWGGGQGTGALVSYSFAWINGLSAVYSGADGQPYSATNEPNATYHFGLSTQQQAAARNALTAWSSVANLGFFELTESSTQVGDIRFAWTSATDTTSTGRNAWGWTYYPGSNAPQSGDIWLSTTSNSAQDNNWSVGSYNYMSLLHEIGHALGLKHPFEGSNTLSSGLDVRNYTLMSYTDPTQAQWVEVKRNSTGGYTWNTSYIEPSTPMVGDILAIQYLYGDKTTTNHGDNVYDFDPTQPFYQTIWDTGGQDTISAARFVQPCTINLNEGSYSSLGFRSNWYQYSQLNWPSTPDTQKMYDGTNNLGIAWGVVIENAIGGSDADVLTGNSADNHLTGGAGNDTLSGGDGTDTAIYTGNVKNYSLRLDRIHYTGTVTDQQIARDGQDTLSNIERLQFADATLNLSVLGMAKTVTATQLQQLEELYVAFFNRIPDGDGLSYWITQLQAGKSLGDIASAFYAAGVQYTSLTGFSATMSDTEFINTIYRHVLGRTEGADTDGLNYWSLLLNTGKATRSSLVSDILLSAHSFKDNIAWGWVANLLDNKITVANTVAVNWGVNFNTPEQSISQGMAIAAAVTPTDTQTAIQLVGIDMQALGLT